MKASQITSLTIVYSIVYSDADQRKHQSSATLAFVRGIHRRPHKWPVTRKIFPFDDVIMMNNFREEEFCADIYNVPLHGSSVLGDFDNIYLVYDQMFLFILNELATQKTKWIEKRKFSV